MADFAPTHPGEILMTEFLEPMGITQYRITKAIGVPPRRINEIVHGKRAITADTALRLSRALGLSDMFFINMQARYDAETARDERRSSSPRPGAETAPRATAVPYRRRHEGIDVHRPGRRHGGCPGDRCGPGARSGCGIGGQGRLD